VIQKKYSYIDFVLSLSPWGMKMGRDNLIKILWYLWSPQDTLQVFHVTGSNWKWSVCQMLSQVLYKKFKKKVGLFTSPHLIDITERFQVNWESITYYELNKYYKRALSLSKKYAIELSFFEIQVLVMVMYFCDQKVDYAVIEVWLGGLYDGTNIFKKTLACFITSITLEHTHVLGKNRKTILRNKLGILKPWTTLYTHIHTLQVREYCRKIGAKLRICTLDVEEEKLTNLPWKHQQKNAVLVLESLRDIGYNSKKIKDALKNIYHPGRNEWISPHLFVDSANNYENIILLKRMLKNTLNDAIIIFGSTQTDPVYVAKLANIFPNQKKILVDGFCERSLPCSQYSHFVPSSTTKHLDTDIWKKFIKNLSKPCPWTQKYILFGSIYLVGYVMRLSRYKIFANK